MTKNQPIKVKPWRISALHVDTSDYKFSEVRKAPKIVSRATENTAGCGREVAENLYLKTDAVCSIMRYCVSQKQ
jgi:hypothetical protein